MDARQIWAYLLLSALYMTGCGRTKDSHLASLASATTPCALPSPVTFSTHVLPILKTSCMLCHSGPTPAAGLGFDRFTDEASAQANPSVWQRVLARLTSQTMPPLPYPAPSACAVATIQAWFDSFAQASCAADSDPGRVALHRLSQTEYNHTLRDLLEDTSERANRFPEDPIANGFDNNADALSIPPTLTESYLAAAEEASERAIVIDHAVPSSVESWMSTELQVAGPAKELPGGWLLMFGADDRLSGSFLAAADGDYWIRTVSYGEQAGPENARLRLRIDDSWSQDREVPATARAPQTDQFRVHLTTGFHQFSVAFANDYYSPNDPDPTQRDRNLAVQRVEVEGPVSQDPRPIPPIQAKIIDCDPAKSGVDACATLILGRMAQLAFRRPVEASEVARLVSVAKIAIQDGEPFERGIQLGLQAILMSPHFLFRVEGLSAGASSPIHDLTDHELATRLSYFLWASMPDERLSKIADQGKLRTDEQIQAEVQRMLQDPKAKDLAEGFGSQWLGYRYLSQTQPISTQFPGFSEDLRSSMLAESQSFMASMLMQDRDLRDLVDSRDAFLNERLAAFYGIPGVTGNAIRQIQLPADSPRGGVITQASFLTLNSNPDRTSPVRRGKRVLEDFLCSAPPPPPPGVGSLPASGDGLTLRQRMENHRRDPNCASCHTQMDPIGFALEGFDGIGAGRTWDEQHLPIDVTGTLPDGTHFNGPKELKSLLTARPAFIECIGEKMATYALGRGPTPQDRCELKKIARNVNASGGRFSALIQEIAHSRIFRMRHEELSGGTR